MERTYTEQFNVRLTKEEKRELEARAKAAGLAPSKWGREMLLKATWPPAEQRPDLEFYAMGIQILRLTILNWATQKPINTTAARDQIEHDSRVAAEGIVQRWLALTGSRAKE